MNSIFTFKYFYLIKIPYQYLLKPRLCYNRTRGKTTISISKPKLFCVCSCVLAGTNSYPAPSHSYWSAEQGYYWSGRNRSVLSNYKFNYIPHKGIMLLARADWLARRWLYNYNHLRASNGARNLFTLFQSITTWSLFNFKAAVKQPPFWFLYWCGSWACRRLSGTQMPTKGRTPSFLPLQESWHNR